MAWWLHIFLQAENRGVHEVGVTNHVLGTANIEYQNSSRMYGPRNTLSRGKKEKLKLTAA